MPFLLPNQQCQSTEGICSTMTTTFNSFFTQLLTATTSFAVIVGWTRRMYWKIGVTLAASVIWYRGCRGWTSATS